MAEAMRASSCAKGGERRSARTRSVGVRGTKEGRRRSWKMCRIRGGRAAAEKIQRGGLRRKADGEDGVLEDELSYMPQDMAKLEREEPTDGNLKRFVEIATSQECNMVPVYERIFADHLTPVLAYRCLVSEDDREAPSFLLESVVNGDQSGRYSFVGAQPAVEIVAKDFEVTILDHVRGTIQQETAEDPMDIPVELSKEWNPAVVEGLPNAFTGGWVGYTSYDTVRYVYKGKLPFHDAPEDDRNLPDIHLALYKNTVVFDQATKLAYAISWVRTDEFDSLEDAYYSGRRELTRLVNKLTPRSNPDLRPGRVSLALGGRSTQANKSNFSKEGFLEAIKKTKEYILSGDIFQLVLSQRFERRTFADPFEIYRALRVVNPSPYMIYMQTRGSILVASSPEILCRVRTRRDGSQVVVNRPLAGTRKRGATREEDVALEKDLLADEKERAEHVMLVDLGRNDVGKVAKSGSVNVKTLMEVERYSHVMHISSTVTGTLKDGLDRWDALRAALPAGTVSGAPKVRAMQIIDELEPHRRGPYGGGVGFASFGGDMDIALALRTMVIPTNRTDTRYRYKESEARKEWVVHIQAGAGVVADSDPESEYEETVNKAAALARAIDLAEQALLGE
eukprot:scaffold153_cov347-Pavlova_lutheri.AAC.56